MGKETTTNVPCCPLGSMGEAKVLSDCPPKGNMVEIPVPSGLVGIKPMPCYCTGSSLSSASSVVVIFTDVYGIDAGHHKVFADRLAQRFMKAATREGKEENVSVIIPDLFRGNPILRPWVAPTSFAKDMVGSFLGFPGMLWRLKKYPPQKVEQEIFQMILPFLQEQAPVASKLSCVGFCFGGWVVGRVLGYSHNNDDGATDETTTASTKSTSGEENTITNSRLFFQCGIGIHPSFQPNMIHGESPQKMAERISLPMLLLPGWNDTDMKPGSTVVNTMTKARQEKEGMATNNEEPLVVSIEFPTMIHGWVTRGDPKDPKIAAEQEKALQLTVDFIQKHTFSN